MSASNIHLIHASSSEKPPEPSLTNLDSFCLRLGVKTMQKNSQSGQSEPTFSAVFWLAVVALAVIIGLAYFIGQLSGYSEGVEKGKEKSTLETLQKQIETLQKQKTDEEKFKQNLKIAEEFDKKQKDFNSNK